MKVNQVATILNQTFNEVIGESALVSDDLSNVVDVGRKITSSATFGNDINGYIKTVWDKVGQTLYNDVNLNVEAYPIFATDAEYGSVLEKIRIIPTDYDDNKAWTFTEGESSTFNDMFGYHPAKVSAKYFNSVVTYRTEPVTITEKQLASAFNSREEMLRFMGMIESAYMSKMKFALVMLSKKVVNGFMAEKIKNNNGVINLLTEYKTATGNTTLTADKTFSDIDFLRFAGSEYKKYIDFLSQPTMLYNTDGYVNYTGKDDLRTIMISDFSRALDTYLYSDTFNPEYLKIGSYNITSYWQGNGTSNDYNDRSSINVIPPSGGDAITTTGIVAVIFDRRACMINARRPETGVQLNNFDNWYNYIYKESAGYFVDTGENGIIFKIADE